jgi:membrane-associated phospholipid phosphatase
MLRRPRTALLGALTCFAGLVLTGVLAHFVPGAQARDSTSLNGFTLLGGPRLDPLLDHVAHLGDPDVYAAMSAALLLAALVQRRWQLAAVIAVLVVVAPGTTELLKPVLSHPRPAEWLGDSQIAAASWPSGHATASMTIALCAVLVAPPAWRPLAAVAGSLFALAVSFSIMVLHWHFPSDVVGGFLVAATWGLLAVAALRRWPPPEREPAKPVDQRAARLPAIALLALAGIAAGAVAIERPRAIAHLIADRPSFAVAAAAIVALAGVLAGALAYSSRA